MSFYIGQKVYLLNDIQQVTIVKDLGNHNFIVNTQSNQQIQVPNHKLQMIKILLLKHYYLILKY